LTALEFESGSPDAKREPIAWLPKYRFHLRFWWAWCSTEFLNG